MISKLTNIFNYNYFFTTPEDSRLIFSWLILYLFLLVFAFILLFLYRERAKIEKPYLSYVKTIFWINFSLSLAGLIFLFLRYEKANFLSWRIWHYIIALAVIFINPYLFTLKKRKLDADLLKYRDQKRKDKWLKKGKKN